MGYREYKPFANDWRLRLNQKKGERIWFSMLKRAREMRVEKHINLRGGFGKVTMTHIMEAEEHELRRIGRLFAKITLPPGASIGYHQHVGESETYYILSGQGEINDNGTKVKVGAGDMVLTREGEYHSVINVASDEDLVLIGLILHA